MELITLGLFCLILLVCVIFNVNILVAMFLGLALFLGYGLLKKHSFGSLMKMSFEGLLTAKNILTAFILIGMMTALWRACGTIAVIVVYASRLIRPEIFLLLSFLLNGTISLLTGTSFGSVATMGVICMSVGLAMGVDPLWNAGAILSGIYIGDRNSPVSTCALLVATQTKTDLYRNIRHMAKSSAVPIAVTAVLYVIGGLLLPAGDTTIDVEEGFSREFTLNALCLIPALLILLLAFFKVKVKKTMAASIAAAFLAGLFIQKLPVKELFLTMLRGYEAHHAELSGMINGGGITSMIRTGVIVGVASCYSGIFRGTGLLDPLKSLVEKAAKRLPRFATMLAGGILAPMVACNQTLATMLMVQIFGDLYREEEREQFALDLADTVVVCSALIPWCIACAVPLSTVGSTPAALLFAFYPYLLPLWRLLTAGKKSFL